MKKEPGKPVIDINNMPLSGDFIGDIRSLIETARHNVAVTVNAGLTITGRSAAVFAKIF